MNGFESLEDALDALELADDLGDVDMSEEEEAYLDEDADWDDAVGLGEVLREALHEDYADALPEELEAALDNMLDSMSPAESVNFVKSLRQIEKGASRTLTDPLVGQIAGTALPMAGGAAGTLLGGPAGTAIGGALGSAAAKALPSAAKAGVPAAAGTASSPPPTMSPATMSPATMSPATMSPAATAPVRAGSAAAAQGFMLTNQQVAQLGMLALALGDLGRRSIDGVPVGALMSMFSSIFAQAAQDADELYYGGDESSGHLYDGETYPSADSASPADRARALYARLIDSDNRRLADGTAL